MYIIVPKRHILITPDEYPQEFLSGCRLRLPLWGYQHRMVGSRFADYSPYGNHGTPFGGYWDKQGQTRVRGEDGVDDYLSTNIIPNLPTKEITIVVWQNVTLVKEQATLQLDSDDTSDRISTHIPWVDGIIYWDFGDINTTGRLTYAPSETITKTWQCFVLEASQSNNFMRIYRNGIEKANKASMSPYSGTPRKITLGQSEFTCYYAGFIAEVQLYNRVKAPEEIRAQYLWDVQHLPFLVGATYLRKYV